ncbi:hypothetical protein J6590_012639 [Homalodisca vitripennis]|nr:hypothetical protein J6590_012639 [Homalodisca vitripennis]
MYDSAADQASPRQEMFIHQAEWCEKRAEAEMRRSRYQHNGNKYPAPAAKRVLLRDLLATIRH